MSKKDQLSEIGDKVYYIWDLSGGSTRVVCAKVTAVYKVKGQSYDGYMYRVRSRMFGEVKVVEHLIYKSREDAIRALIPKYEKQTNYLKKTIREREEAFNELLDELSKI